MIYVEIDPNVMYSEQDIAEAIEHMLGFLPINSAVSIIKED